MPASRMKTSQTLEKRIKGTNIVVQKSAADDISDPFLATLNTIQPDDQTEILWWSRTLRPERNLIHPAEAFLQGIKELRPAPVFNTFDVKKAKMRRMVKQERDRKTFLARRQAAVAPTAAYRAAMNPHKLQRGFGGQNVQDEEIKMLGAPKKKNAKENNNKLFFNKWKKAKVQSIGKGL
ncbi:hypothetical protein STCU_03699 [Strigomonas culicis]|uniref:Uncharacterized protein n=1 Tax=Strigomonas culicis TaxID=28005 RepID=S9UQC0_9TRYP|nr:hypothetical protein STCU_03699 [Strigomonas culicis]|eukprot:EPY31004.1 hypothetical protein STCU_03699 [Strigomonas culicis]